MPPGRPRLPTVLTAELLCKVYGMRVTVERNGIQCPVKASAGLAESRPKRATRLARFSPIGTYRGSKTCRLQKPADMANARLLVTRRVYGWKADKLACQFYCVRLHSPDLGCRAGLTEIGFVNLFGFA